MKLTSQTGRRSQVHRRHDNAKIYFKEKYKEKVMYRKTTAKQMGYANGAKETWQDNLKEPLSQMVEASQEDGEYVNSAVETNKKLMETMIEVGNGKEQ